MRERGVKAVKQNQSVGKVFRIIECMAGRRGAVRLQDIAADAGVPASTALRFVTTLMEHGYAVQDGETLKYSLTFKLCRVAEQIRAGHQLIDIVHSELEGLTRRCGESSCLAVGEGSEVVYIDVVEGADSTLRTLQRIGKRAPLHSTGVGKSLLLNCSRQQLEEMAARSGLPRLTPHTITSIDALADELDLIRRRGFAMDNEECEEGVRCVAAPVRDYTGSVVCSISVSGPVHRMDSKRIEEISAAVREAAGRLSGRLSFHPPGQPARGPSSEAGPGAAAPARRPAIHENAAALTDLTRCADWREQAAPSRHLPASALATFVPVTAAAILSCAQFGSGGLKELLRKTLDYNKTRNKIWYLPVLLMAPFIYFLSYAAMRLTGLPLPEPVIPLQSVPVFFLVCFIGAAGEELGWSGYAIDPLRSLRDWLVYLAGGSHRPVRMGSGKGKNRQVSGSRVALSCLPAVHSYSKVRTSSSVPMSNTLTNSFITFS